MDAGRAEAKANELAGILQKFGVPLRRQFEVFERALNFKRMLLRISTSDQSKEKIQ